jgi:hypothetical protein
MAATVGTTQTRTRTFAVKGIKMVSAFREFLNLRTIRGWIGLVIILGAIVLAATTLRAGPLSDTEVIGRVGGIPTDMQVVACSTASATATTALPTNSLIRLVPEGGSVFYNFVAQAGSVTLANGAFLPQNLVEYVQNGPGAYAACITRAGTANLSIAVMR